MRVFAFGEAADPGGEFSQVTPIERVRRVCLALDGAEEKLSHGEPTFFVKKRVFAMFSNNHHGDGHVAAIVPARAGVQEELVSEEPTVYFRPPYVGVKGWVGIELAGVNDEVLAVHLREAYELIANKSKSKRA